MSEPAPITTPPPPAAEPLFVCTSAPADFTIRSIPDAPIAFRVSRAALTSGSEVFRDMFELCEDPASGVASSPSSTQDSLDLDERAEILALLLRLLHDPPEPYVPETDLFGHDVPSPLAAGTLPIPLPLLPTLFGLADKYALVPALLATLQSHLAAHAQTEPLQVYAYAWTLELPSIAARASAFLIAPPLHTYSPKALSILPSIESLHLLYLLQAHRVQRLREVLAGEEMFTRGYGACTRSGHAQRLEAAWKKKAKSLHARIEAATDVATEMQSVFAAAEGCETCRMSCVRAIEMLRYKCKKVPRKINKIPIPGEETAP